MFFSWKAGALKDSAFAGFKLESQQKTAELAAKAAEANKIAAEAKERTALAELELEKLKHRWVTISQWQKFREVSVLNKKELILLSPWVSGDREAEAFMVSIAIMLNDCGYKTVYDNSMKIGRPGSGVPQLSVISNPSIKDSALLGKPLADAMKAAGFAVVYLEQPLFSNFPVVIEVGPKPLY